MILIEFQTKSIIELSEMGERNKSKEEIEAHKKFQVQPKS